MERHPRVFMMAVVTKWRPTLLASLPRFLLTGRHYSQNNITSSARGIETGPGLKDFIKKESNNWEYLEDEEETIPPYLNKDNLKGRDRKVFFDVYGCQMNISDAEVAWSVLKDAGYQRTIDVTDADVILAVTCAIRENAERKIWDRLDFFKSLKRKRSSKLPKLKVGLLGCMAERLKEKALETDKKLDLVAGPDAYRDLPRLLATTEETGQPSVNVLLSMDETYADIAPVRMNENSPTAYVSVMRGCDNMCSFCIVPFTRGRERSRPLESICNEIKALSEQGVKQVTLLGQNVNSYRDLSSTPSLSPSFPSLSSSPSPLSKGFTTIYKEKKGGRQFAELLHEVAQIDPEMRIRFTSPHPKDFPDELLQVINEHSNICNSIHLPVQSGSDNMLKIMRRGHTREAYLQLVDNIKSTIPDVTLSSDFIAGFCEESEEDHQDTLSLLNIVQYDMAYLFAYSMRKKTHAYHRMNDTVPEDVKKRRVYELSQTFYKLAEIKHRPLVGTEQLVLIESESKKRDGDLKGRTDGNIKVLFPSSSLPSTYDNQLMIPSIGDYVRVKIISSGPVTLRGIPLQRTTLQSYYKHTNI